MTEVVNRSSADESEEKQHTLSLTENSPTSGGIESEYDTASTNSRSNEHEEYEDSEEDSLDEEISDEEVEGGDDERESGDGQEELESENGTKKKVDHDEDRSNPQYIPKKGTFYEHDDRTVEDLGTNEVIEISEVNEKNSTEGLSTVGKILTTQNLKVTLKTAKKTTKETDRWSHDRFNEFEQAPKSRAELVSAYGYDIRSEDGPPRPRRQRRYGRHQSKYSRNWEDEEAYKKSQSIKPITKRPLRAEDFPVLGSTPKASGNRDRLLKLPLNSRQSQDENDTKPYISPERKREHRPLRDDREKSSWDQRSQRYNNDTSNNNNARQVKGKKNINFNHNIEFKNQNRKNINYETKNNNVLNQQMQSGNQCAPSSSHMHPQSQNLSQSQLQQNIVGNAHPQAVPSNQRFNNNENPLPTLSFTNSKMNNAANSLSSVPHSSSSRGILNFDNSSGNYGRGNASSHEKEKDVNNQTLQHVQTMSPNKNIQQQYDAHQIDQMKFMEKSYSQQQGKTMNLNLNQHQTPQDPSLGTSTELSRSKRYSNLRQRSTMNDVTTTSTHQQASSPLYHTQYHQQEMESAIVQIPSQQNQSYISQQQSTQAPSNILNVSTASQQPQQGATVQQGPKYQAAYYTANPASDFALMQAAMVEKYQYQQQPTTAQYIQPQQQTQQIYLPTQSQPSQQQQILNYVSTIQPQGPSGAPAYPQYTNYQNYNIQTSAPTANAQQAQLQQPPVAQQSQSTPQGIYQTQSGLTYFPNTQITAPHQQRIVQPQRRPIPILAPPDKNKMKASGSSNTDDGEKNIDDKESVESENIDHILDNMFVQRPMTNVISLKDPTSALSNEDQFDEQINENMNNMSLDDDKKADTGK